MKEHCLAETMVPKPNRMKERCLGRMAPKPMRRNKVAACRTDSTTDNSRDCRQNWRKD